MTTFGGHDCASCGDPRFFRVAGPFAAGHVAAIAGGTLDPADGEAMVSAVAPLQSAGRSEVSFLDNRKYLPVLAASQAGFIIVHPEFRDRVPAGARAILTEEPYLGWARVAALFHPDPPMVPGVHASAVIATGVLIDPTAEVGPFAVIGAGAIIGRGARIGAHAVIGRQVVVGPDCWVGDHASVSHAILGERVVLGPGARIGQDGFGFARTKAGFVSVPQLGRVLLEDDVHVGANTAIDRGSVQDTVIGAGSRLDNLVMIGHNVRLGRCCVIVAQAGISGSTVLEDFVMVAGQAGLIGHLRIGRSAQIGAQAGVMADVAANSTVLGSPASPIKAFFRQVAALRRLAKGPGARPSARDTEDAK